MKVNLYKAIFNRLTNEGRKYTASRPIPYFLLLTSYLLLLSACLIVYPFQDISHIEERMKEMYNLDFINSLPPLDTGDGNYSFIIMSDVHIGRGDLHGLLRLPAFIDENPDIKFVVLAGDLTNDGRHADFRKYVEIADSLKKRNIPFYPVLGNHDLAGDGWSWWKANIGTTIYRIDDQNATLIFLDNANLYFSKDQLNWLEDQLNSRNTINSDSKNTFIFSHVPIFASGPAPWVTITDLAERARIVNILRDKADMVFAGHAHARNSYNVGNVEYITVDEFESTQKYCIVTVRNGVVKYGWGKLSP